MGRSVGRPVAGVVLSVAERSFLERRRVRRRIALHCADGSRSKAVAAEPGMHERTVGKRRRRFPKDRVEGLSDARAGEVVKRALETPPPTPRIGRSARWPSRRCNRIGRRRSSFPAVRRSWARRGTSRGSIRRPVDRTLCGEP